MAIESEGFRLRRLDTTMTHENLNGPGPSALCASEPQGRAALLLVESLIHTLIERSLIDHRASTELVRRAIDAHLEYCYENGLPLDESVGTNRLLDQILRTFEIDLTE